MKYYKINDNKLKVKAIKLLEKNCTVLGNAEVEYLVQEIETNHSLPLPPTLKFLYIQRP